MKDLQGFLADPAVCRESFHLLVQMATRLAAAGLGKKVLTAVERSPEAARLRPLADGLKLHLGMEIDADDEGAAMAREIAGRICEDVAV